LRFQNTNERRRRINNIIIAVTCVFFVSWLPLNVFQVPAPENFYFLSSLSIREKELIVLEPFNFHFAHFH
jgi:hypothetical protein